MKIGSLVVYVGPPAPDRPNPHGVGVVELPLAQLSSAPSSVVARWFFQRRADGTVEKEESLRQFPVEAVRAATPNDLMRHLGECLPAALPDGSVLQVTDIGAATFMGKILGAAMLSRSGEMSLREVLAEPVRAAFMFREAMKFALDPSPEKAREAIFGGNPSPASVAESLSLRESFDMRTEPPQSMPPGLGAAPLLSGGAPMADAARLMQQIMSKAEMPSTAALYLQYLAVLLAHSGDAEFGGDDAVEKISSRAEALARRARRVVETMHLEDSASGGSDS